MECQARRHHGGARLRTVRHGARPVHTTTGKEELIVGVYVDDPIVTGAREEDIAKFKAEMAARFKMSDLGALSYYLGIEVKQGKDAVMLGQRAYALKLLERAGMGDCRAAATPMEERIKFSKQSVAKKVDATRY